MRIIIAVAMVALVVPGAGLALAQTPQERIDAAMERARDAGIPVALLDTKIAEGQAKGIPMFRIAAAIERREGALERASETLRGQSAIGTADLAVAADAIESGVSAAVLLAVFETAPQERRVVAIAALTQLVELGYVPEAALERVVEALERGSEALLNLPAEAASAAGRRGGPPNIQVPNGAGASPPAGIPAPGLPPLSNRPGGPPATPDSPTNPPATPGSPTNPPGGGR